MIFFILFLRGKLTTIGEKMYHSFINFSVITILLVILDRLIYCSNIEYLINMFTFVSHSFIQYLSTNRCKFRVLDSFGTEAMYNNREYANKFNHTSKYGFISTYGQQSLPNLKQFYTLYRKL